MQEFLSLPWDMNKKHQNILVTNKRQNKCHLHFLTKQTNTEIRLNSTTPHLDPIVTHNYQNVSTTTFDHSYQSLDLDTPLHSPPLTPILHTPFRIAKTTQRVSIEWDSISDAYSQTEALECHCLGWAKPLSLLMPPKLKSRLCCQSQGDLWVWDDDLKGLIKFHNPAVLPNLTQFQEALTIIICTLFEFFELICIAIWHYVLLAILLSTILN